MSPWPAPPTPGPDIATGDPRATVQDFPGRPSVTPYYDALGGGYGDMLHADGLQNLINHVADRGGGIIKYNRPATVDLRGARQQTGTAQGYNYSGQILFPGIPFTTVRVPIIIVGPTPTPLQRWGADPEPSWQGSLKILSDATTGAIWDVIPGETVAGIALSNIFAGFYNLISAASYSLPTADNLKLLKAACADIRHCIIHVDLPAPSVGTGGTAIGLDLPDEDNGGYVHVSDTEIYGYHHGLRHTEHAVLEDVVVRKADAAYMPHGGKGSSSQYRRCFAHDVGDVLNPDDAFGGYIGGDIQVEAATAFFVNDAANALAGDITFSRAQGVGFPIVGAQNLNFRNLNQGRAGWMDLPPHDTFGRINNFGSGFLGAADLSNTPWNVLSGLWGTFPGPNTCYPPHDQPKNLTLAPWYSRKGFATLAAAGISVPRSILIKCSTPVGAYDFGLVIAYSASSGNYLYCTLSGGFLTLFKNVGGVVTQLAQSAAGAVVANHAGYVIMAKCVFSIDTSVAQTVGIYKGGAQQLVGGVYTLTAQDITDLNDTSTNAKNQGVIQDGLYSSSADTGSTINEYRVIPN